MGDEYNNHLKINKVGTSTSKGYKLGSTNATWKKLKQATSYSPKPKDIQEHNIIEHGPNGELLIIYPESYLIEIWHWVQPEFKSTVSRDFSGDTLYFYTQVTIFAPDSSPAIESLDIILGDMNSGYNVLILFKKDNNFDLRIYNMGISKPLAQLKQVLLLPDYFEGSTQSLTVKLSNQFIVFGNDEGFLYCFTYAASTDKFIPSNTNENLKSLKKSSSLPILRKYKLLNDVNENDFVLKTSRFKTKPIFDISNNWLVYSPTETEYAQMKLENTLKFTPVNLPTSKHLLSDVLEGLSNYTLDLLFKLSKFSTAKLNEFLKEEEHKDVNLSSLKKALDTVVNKTITTTKRNFQTVSDNQIVKIVDLANDKVLTVFNTPDGISNLSFNPYDLQLVNANFRGDNFFIWDLIKIPNEISLMGKFRRGKTSGTIDNIFWFVNSSNTESDDLLNGTNSGFGCINSDTGTIHWYNINYLLGNLNNNLPNYLGKPFPLDDKLPKDFLNDWILSLQSQNNKYVKFLKLPNLLNLKHTDTLNQLAVLDEANNLKLVSPLNGRNSYKFELPSRPTNSKLVYKEPVIAQLPSSKEPKESTSISQIEIETSKPFVNFMTLKNVLVAVYDFEDTSKTDSENICHYYENLVANKIPTKSLDFVKKEQTDFVEDLVDNLLDYN